MSSYASKNIRPQYRQVVIVGAGVSGIAMACMLRKKLGVEDFVILDKEPAPAGTWHVNTYPNAGCDVPSPVYSFSFRQKTDWSSFFPKQAELREYFLTVVAEYRLNDRMHLSTTVREARFDKSTSLWHLWCEDVDSGELHHYVAPVFVSAVGGLSQPNECTIDGHETFEGPLFHSARWNHDADLTDKNVIVVGNGCSATQFVPPVAEKAKMLTQFVRSKHWYAPVPKDPFTKLPGWRWLVRHFAFFRNLQRFLVWMVLESHFFITQLNPIGHVFRWWWARACTANVKKNAPKEYWPMLLTTQKEMKVGCKRRVIDETYLPALKRNNVHLESSKLVKIHPKHVETADGRKLPADVIILATGFATARNGFPMSIWDKDGKEIHEHFERHGNGGPMSYRSTMLAGFPNYFTCVGTNSATGHMSLIFTSEAQISYIIELIKPIMKAPRPSEAQIKHLPGQAQLPTARALPSVDVKLEAELAEQQWIQSAMQKLVFSTGCGSWYVDKASGRVTAMYPDWQWRFLQRATFPVWEDLIYTGLPRNASRPDTVPLWKRAGCWLGLGTVPRVSAAEAQKATQALKKAA